MLRVTAQLAVLAVLCMRHACAAETDHASPAIGTAATYVAGGPGMPASIPGGAQEELPGRYYMYDTADLDIDPGAVVEYADDDSAAWSDGPSGSRRLLQPVRNSRPRCAVAAIYATCMSPAYYGTVPNDHETHVHVQTHVPNETHVHVGWADSRVEAAWCGVDTSIDTYDLVTKE